MPVVRQVLGRVLNSALRFVLHPYPARALSILAIRDLKLLPYPLRVQIGAVRRPQYAYCVYNAGILARKLGFSRISVVEFGVAGGEGLLNLASHASETARCLGIDIEVYGFDTGRGLPEPLDYRDLPYHWRPGFYGIDLEQFRPPLGKARLVLGDVRETVPRFFQDYAAAPLAAAMFDLDYYSSTRSALGILKARAPNLLPRIYCYFDDVIGSEVELYTDWTGVRNAIREFNEAHEECKLARAYHLLCRRVVEPWYHQIYISHDFSHPRYNDFVSEESQQLPLSNRSPGAARPAS